MTDVNSGNSSSFLWNHKGAFFPLSLALPFIFQGGSVAIKVLKDPQIVSTKLSAVKKLFVHSFSKQEDETESEFHRRLLKNVLLVLAASQLIALSIGASFVLLSPGFAIPIALSVICFTADFMLNAESYMQKWSANWVQSKTWIKKSFTRRPDEAKQAAALRIIRNIAIASVVTAAIVGIGVSLQHLTLYLLHAIASGRVSFWNPYDLLPSQTPLVVFLEYASLSVVHGALAIKELKEGKKARALFHLVNLCLGFFFPLFYLFNPHEGMRIHHSFLGLLISLAPSDSLKIYGSLTTMDSFAYVFSRFRGYWTVDDWGWRKWHRWDFQNLVLDNFSKYFGAYFTAASAEIALKNIFRSKRICQKKEEVRTLPH